MLEQRASSFYMNIHISPSVCRLYVHMYATISSVKHESTACRTHGAMFGGVLAPVYVVLFL
jgi:hypothetical protein